MLLFGELLFVFALTRVSYLYAWETHAQGGIEPGVRPHIAWALVFSAVSWAVWLAIVAARMAGTSLRQALDADTMMLVLRESEFGHWWCVRIVVLVILGVVWSSSPRRSTSDSWQRTETLLVLALAAIYLATLAFAGHAAAAAQGAVAGRASWLAMRRTHWPRAHGSVHCRRWCLLGSGQSSAILARGTHLFSLAGHHERFSSSRHRNRQRLVSGRLISQRFRHAIRSTAGFKARAVRGDAIDRSRQSMHSYAAPVQQRRHRGAVLRVTQRWKSSVAS